MNEKKIYTVYAAEADMTFIMEQTIDECEGYGCREITEKVVGWYFGEPDEESTRGFYNKLEATYPEPKE